MAIDDVTAPRGKLLRLSAWLLLAGQVLYVAITLFHAGGPANDHQVIFAAYAASASWTAVHVAQFLCMSILLAGFLTLFFAMDTPPGAASWSSRVGAAMALVSLALYGAVLAVDGVALKQAVNAWASAPEAEKAARFASAETMRWLEWGMRSYENFALGLTLLLFAATLLRSAWAPRLLALLMALSGLAYFAQGWTAGSEGFSPAHEIAIISSEVLNAAWMIWLLILASRTRPAGSYGVA
jgi:hypothetical protein